RAVPHVPRVGPLGARADRLLRRRPVRRRARRLRRRRVLRLLRRGPGRPEHAGRARAHRHRHRAVRRLARPRVPDRVLTGHGRSAPRSRTKGHKDVTLLGTRRETAENDARGTGPATGRLDRFFRITERGSTTGRELGGGLVTFFAMAYIVILNPLILGGTSAENAPVDAAGRCLQTAQVRPMTGLAAGGLTILFGLVASLPFALAAGLGINSFLAVAVIGDVTWPEAMGLVLVNGLLIVLLAVTGARSAIFNAVPRQLKAAITVGIGLFIAFIGFVDAGFVTRTPGGPPVQLGDGGSITSVPTLVFVVGLLAMGILVARKVKGGLLVGLVATTVVAIVVESVLHLGPASEQNPGGWHLTVPTLPSSLVSVPDLGLLGQFSFGAFDRIGALAATMLVFTLFFTNFFDAMGTMTGLAKQGGLADADGNFPRIKSALVVEGVGAVVGGATSSSSNTV